MTKLLILLFTASFLLVSCGKKTQETKPIRKDATEAVFASGLLEAKGTYSLTAQADGYLIKINFKEGDVVQQGAVLAVVDNKESSFNTESATALYNIAQSNTSGNAPVLAQAKTAIDIAQQKMDQDALQEQRYKRLWASNSIAKVDYENTLVTYNNSKSSYDAALESYKKSQQDARQQLISNKATKQVSNIVLGKNDIRAVVSGKVYKKFKEEGDFVKKGDIIATIGDANFIYAKVNVDESNIAKIKIGQDATIQLNTNKGKVYKGKVAEIYPSFDDASQSFICKIYFTDTLDFTIVNTQLQTNIIIGIQKNALLIPRNYIDYGGFVQVKNQQGKTKVQTAFVGEDWVQVISGIDDNTILVTDNLAGNSVKTSEVGSQFH